MWSLHETARQNMLLLFIARSRPDVIDIHPVHVMADDGGVILPCLCVASPQGDVLVEHASRTGNAGEIAARILQRLPHR